MNKRILVIAATVVIVATGCGANDGGAGSSASGAASSAPASSAAQHHSNQDVMFAQMMIPHHRQAIEMAKLAATRAKHPEVKALARQIEQAQDPEIKTMTGWLTQWGAQVPEGDMGHGMDHGGGGSGMMSAEDMARLEDSSGAEFDKMFLTMMIEHHEGAVTMAKQQQAKGTFAPAKTMASAIITTQTAEITKMRQLAEK